MLDVYFHHLPTATNSVTSINMGSAAHSSQSILCHIQIIRRVMRLDRLWFKARMSQKMRFFVSTQINSKVDMWEILLRDGKREVQRFLFLQRNSGSIL